MSNNIFDFIDEMFNEIYYPVKKDSTIIYQSVHNSFPYTDIYYDNDNEDLCIEIALAGYKKEDITVEINNNMLVVLCKHQENKKNRVYKLQGIKNSDCSRTMIIPDFYINSEPDVSFVDGVLKIVFKKDENKKKKLLNIK